MKTIKQIITIVTIVVFTFGSFFNVNAQEYKTTDKVATSVKLTGKFHAVITYLETKEFYKKGMSKSDFVKATTSCVDEKELVSIFRPYMEEIYNFHTKNLTPDQVYDNIDGRNFAKTVTALKKYEKSTGRNASKKKPRWFNWLRKFIDWLDDNWE